MKNNNKETIKKQVTLDGLMTIGMSENGLHMADFECCEDVVMEDLDLSGKRYLAVEFIPGQFDQRASSAIDCVHLIDPNADIDIRSSRLLIFEDELTADEMAKIRHYYINAVEAREKDLSILSRQQTADVKPLASLAGFTAMQKEQYSAFCKEWGLAMNADDLACVAEYFSKEHRDPTETELRILDTYWSDHCRHTTFTTILEDIEVEDSFIKADIESELNAFHHIRTELGREAKPLCLMELATIGARYLKKKGLLDDMEVSEENNACSIYVDVDEPAFVAVGRYDAETGTDRADGGTGRIRPIPCVRIRNGSIQRIIRTTYMCRCRIIQQVGQRGQIDGRKWIGILRI